MKRKDCEERKHADAREGACRPARAACLAVSIALLVGAPTSHALAGSVRLWPMTVVVDDTILLADLCELRGFEDSTERMLAELAVTDAPPAGGSRVIHMDMIRSALAAGGANMATVTLSGATRCNVTRPSKVTASPESAQQGGMRKGAAPSRSRYGTDQYLNHQGGGARDTSVQAVTSHKPTSSPVTI